MMGQAREAAPVVHVRGFPYKMRESSLEELIRPYRTGYVSIKMISIATLLEFSANTKTAANLAVVREKMWVKWYKDCSYATSILAGCRNLRSRKNEFCA